MSCRMKIQEHPEAPLASMIQLPSSFSVPMVRKRLKTQAENPSSMEPPTNSPVLLKKKVDQPTSPIVRGYHSCRSVSLGTLRNGKGQLCSWSSDLTLQR